MRNAREVLPILFGNFGPEDQALGSLFFEDVSPTFGRVSAHHFQIIRFYGVYCVYHQRLQAFSYPVRQPSLPTKQMPVSVKDEHGKI